MELDELVSGEWKETARWIKFEEDVEESQKWSKPRVASLSFHSLLELRRSIEKGRVSDRFSGFGIVNLLLSTYRRQSFVKHAFLHIKFESPVSRLLQSFACFFHIILN